MDSSDQEIRSHHVSTAATEDGNTATGIITSQPSSIVGEDSQKGIDIRQALEILSSRAPHSHSHSHSHPHDHNHSHGTPCCGDTNNKPPADVLKNMGQTIDLFAPSPTSSLTLANTSSPSEPTTPGSDPVDPVERRKRIRESLKHLPTVALLRMVLTAQEDRVRTYRLYDEALDKVLVSNRLTDYPPACVAATAAFSVLSDTVVAVRDELSNRVEGKGKNDPFRITVSSVIESIGDLQSSEREKLQLTAAYHLEQIRANNAKEFNTSADEDDNGDGDRREFLLLKKEVASLRSRIETCRSNISDVMEDLRCALVDLMDEEEDV